MKVGDLITLKKKVEPPPPEIKTIGLKLPELGEVYTCRELYEKVVDGRKRQFLHIEEFSFGIWAGSGEEIGLIVDIWNVVEPMPLDELSLELANS